MKKITLLFTLTFMLVFCAFSDTGDALIYADINSAFKTGFYPGVVDKTNALEHQYPDSSYLSISQIMKGQSLIKMYRYDEAISTLNNLKLKLTNDKENLVKVSYYLGQAYYFNHAEEAALKQFYEVCSAGEKSPYYASAVLLAGTIYFEKKDYKAAENLLEYVVQNGSKYALSDYDNALEQLFICYSQLKKYKKGVELFNQLNKSDFSDDVYVNLSLYAAVSFENNNQEEKAYSLYSSVVQSGIKTPAVIAMKKAYLLASSGRVKADPADIFSTATQTFSDSPALVCDFWVRLGIDEFNNKNYDKAKEYFRNAQILIDNGVHYDQSLLNLYDAKILVEADKSYEKAEKLLLSMPAAVEKSEIKNIKDSYYSALIQVKSLLGKWEDISSLFRKVLNPDLSTQYNYARAIYELKRYSDCAVYLKALIDAPQTGNLSDKNLCLYELYACANTKCGDYSASAQVYNLMEKTGLLSEADKIEYAKVLYYCCDYEKCLKVVNETIYSQKDYISGLCKINQKDWRAARESFIFYIKNQSRSKDFNMLSHFYKGYSEYNLADTRDAYVTFVRYATDAPKNQGKYIYQAYEYAAKCALQNGDYSSAASNAEQLIKLASTDEDKQNAVLFCAEIYSSTENYAKAIDVLEPYSKAHNAFAVQCLFQIAKNEEKQNRISAAEMTYTKIFTDFPESEQAEEAMYSLGGLYYSRGDYVTAENRYNKYIYKFVDGKFSDAAFFYCADSELKIGATEKSIMMNRNLIQTYPDSVYLYGAYRNLLNAYYKIEDYSNALTTAKTMLSKYSKQAAEDGVGRTEIELEKIVSGTDSKLAKKLSEYENKGKTSTVAGRNTGTELVALYAAQNDSGMEEAFKLAKELLSAQTEPEEKYNAGKNADFIASYYRRKLENENAAQYFLKAAGFYRSSGEASADEIAAALYGAVEAFKAGGFNQDASDTVDLLVQLYPKSQYAARARALIR